MNVKAQKIYLSLLALTIFASVSIFSASAQTGGACQVMSAEFRTSRALSPTFVDDADRPFVYIDIETQNCAGETIQISITDTDTGFPDYQNDDVDGNIGSNDPCDNNNFSCMDNRIVGVIYDDFTLSLRAGEDECDDADDPDCRYFLMTWDEVQSGHVWTSGLQLNYWCNGACNTNWLFNGILNGSDFGGFDAEDTDNDPQNNDDTGVDITPPPNNNPPGTSSTNTIDLGLTNPLAGTIDNIPQLFQKIIYIVIKIGIPLVAIAILYSGFLFVTARGRDEQLKTAKNVLLFAVIGGLLLLASWLVAEAIRDALLNINNP